MKAAAAAASAAECFDGGCSSTHIRVNTIVVFFGNYDYEFACSSKDFVCLFVFLDAFIEGKWVSHQGFSLTS